MARDEGRGSPSDVPKMVEAYAPNGRDVSPEDRCRWCGRKVGKAGAAKSVPGFPYCADPCWKK